MSFKKYLNTFEKKLMWNDVKISIDHRIIESKPLNYQEDKAMIIQATFKGKHMSLGYLPNKVYTLKLNANEFIIQRLDGSGKCPYTSIRAFLLNWENISILKQ